jgi:hypothetical protein
MQKPLAPLPTFKPLGRQSPDLVKVFDKIRFGPLGDAYEYDEFIWFVREYPRVYRHHYKHAEYRLTSIHQAYREHHVKTQELLSGEFKQSVEEDTFLGYSYSNRMVLPIYWDFESYLQAVSSTLDVTARIAGTAFKQGAPHSFNRFCKRAPDGVLKVVFLRAHHRWVERMKTYRDCFVHHTPIDTLLTMQIESYSDVFELRGSLPVNPEVHDILLFRYSRRVELLKYAITVWRHLAAFDRAVAKIVLATVQEGTLPRKDQQALLMLAVNLELRLGGLHRVETPDNTSPTQGTASLWQRRLRSTSSR